MINIILKVITKYRDALEFGMRSPKELYHNIRCFTDGVN
jgi:hypothetical protein